MSAASYVIYGKWEQGKVVKDMVKHLGFSDEYAKQLHEELGGKLREEIKTGVADNSKGVCAIIADLQQKIEQKTAEFDAKFSAEWKSIETMGEQLKKLGMGIMQVGTMLSNAHKVKSDCQVIGERSKQSTSDTLDILVQNLQLATSREFQNLIGRRLDYNFLFCKPGEEAYSP